MLIYSLFCWQLDENIAAEALELCVAYFNTVYPVLRLKWTKPISWEIVEGPCHQRATGAAVIKTLIQVLFPPVNEYSETHCYAVLLTHQKSCRSWEMDKLLYFPDYEMHQNRRHVQVLERNFHENNYYTSGLFGSYKC